VEVDVDEVTQNYGELREIAYKVIKKEEENPQ